MTKVIVIDICSSTTIIEMLALSGRMNDYNILINVISAFLFGLEDQRKITVYKFTGDGFIFFSEECADEIMEIILDLQYCINDVLKKFCVQYLDNASLPRLGLTIGIAQGKLFPLEAKLFKTTEFAGRPINVACRFQASLKGPDDINCLIVDQDFYNEITLYQFLQEFELHEKAFKGIGKDNPIKCYKTNLTNRQAVNQSFIRHSRKEIIEVMNESKLFDSSIIADYL